MNGLGWSLRSPQPAGLKARSQCLHCTALTEDRDSPIHGWNILDLGRDTKGVKIHFTLRGLQKGGMLALCPSLSPYCSTRLGLDHTHFIVLGLIPGIEQRLCSNRDGKEAQARHPSIKAAQSDLDYCLGIFGDSVQRAVV